MSLLLVVAADHPPQKHGPVLLLQRGCQKTHLRRQEKGLRESPHQRERAHDLKEHLLGVLKLIPKDLLFILETNGILIGHEPDYAGELARFGNLHVRVSLKGSSRDEFSRLTNAKLEGFNLQIKALENLVAAGVSTNLAVMVSFSTAQNLESLRKRLSVISPGFHDFETEELAFYGDAAKRLKAAGIDYEKGYRPDSIPPEQI